MLISEHGPFTRYEEQLTTIYHELLDSRGQFRRGLCSSLFHSVAAEIVLNAWDLARPSYTRNDILRLCGEMRAQPERRFRLSDLAEMAGVSPRQLRRVFVSEIGMTPKEFEIESRMAHAEFLLANQGLKVREVAHACGYSDPFLFSRQFSKLRDRNPSSYRSGQPMSTSGNPIPRPD
jgi:AraC-like DNA-binding protein